MEDSQSAASLMPRRNSTRGGDLRTVRAHAAGQSGRNDWITCTVKVRHRDSLDPVAAPLDGAPQLPGLPTIEP
jgi:hypothetical protein